MTELTDEAVKALLDGATPGWELLTRRDGSMLILTRNAIGSPNRHIAEMSWGVYEPGNGEGDAQLASAAPDLARALLDARSDNARLRAEMQRLRDERDSLRQSLDACIPAVEEAAIKRGQAEAERDAALARVEKLRHQITEASDPDFILGAMDNVNDMDVTLDGFAQAASRAIRAALAHNGRGE